MPKAAPLRSAVFGIRLFAALCDMSTMSHVFISYVQEDAELVDWLADLLRHYGIKVWLDRTSLNPGERWQQAIQNAIRSGAFFVACFSRAYQSRTKTYMNEELAIAIEELRQRPHASVWFLPVVIGDAKVPDISVDATTTLKSFQFISLRDPLHPYADFRQILRAIDPESSRVDELREQLRSDSVRQRIAAADALGNLGRIASGAVTHLTLALTDDNETVRAVASDSLGKIAVANDEIITNLAELIRNDDHYVFKHAALALAKLGDEGISMLRHLQSEQLAPRASRIVRESLGQRPQDEHG